MVLKGKINLLVTIDKNYIPYMNVMISSLLFSNPETFFQIYIIQSSLSEEDVSETRKITDNRAEVILINAHEVNLENAPTTSRYPKEIYYRIFAAKYLPENLDRILYLDPDIIVNGSLDELYDINMDGMYFAAASHNGNIMHKVNEIRLDMEDDSPYINSGVMMINLRLLRKEQNYEEVFEFINKHKNHLILPDQDIISSLYGSKIIPLDTYKYNMTERKYRIHSKKEGGLNIEWVRNNSVIIHFCGRNKPWKNNYFGKLNVFYEETVRRMKEKDEQRNA